MTKDFDLKWTDLEKIPATLAKLGKVDAVIGILRGGAIPAIMASHYFASPVYWIEIKTYKNRKKLDNLSHALVTIPEKFDAGSRILLVDDIFDTGRTFDFVCTKYLHGLADVCVLKFTLISKELGGHVHRDLKYLYHVDKDVWVNFPWESKRTD